MNILISVTARRKDCPARGLPGAWTARRMDCPARGRKNFQTDVICKIWPTSFAKFGRRHLYVRRRRRDCMKNNLKIYILFNSWAFSEQGFALYYFYFFNFGGDERVRRSPLSQIIRSSYPRLG